VARRRLTTRPVKRVVKLTLHPERDADIIALIDEAPNKAQLFTDALRGHAPTPAKVEAEDDLADALDAFVM